MAQRPLPAEVLYHVAEYFTPGQAASPCLVSRNWHNIFADRIWSKCTLSEHGRLPPVAGLVRNANHVTDLYLFGTDIPQGYLSVPFTRLTRLTLYHCTHTFSNSNKQEIAGYVAQLVANNDFLHELVLDDPNLSGVREIWDCISLRGKDSKLQRVAFGGLALSPAEFAVFWQSCVRAGVQHLKLTDFRNTDKYRNMDQVYDELEALPELQSMSLDKSVSLSLLLLCPNLRKLDLNSREGMFILARMVSAGYLKHLDVLHLTQFEDQWAALLVQQMGRIKEFMVRSTQPIHRTSEALERHFATLQVVSFTMESEAPQGMSLTLLESCPLLTHVCGPPIQAREIIDGKVPWACTHLRSFKIFVAVDQDAIAAESRAVFERLSELEYLTELSIRPPSSYTTIFARGLDLTLTSGLGRLGSLTRLVKLDFTSTVQNMSSTDVAWMKNNWKDLETVLGLCNNYGGFRQQPTTGA